MERLGLNATNEIAKKITEGTAYNDDGIDTKTREVLKYLALKEGSKRFFEPRPLDIKECQEGWKKVTERTSSSMRHGTHFGHWITGYTDEEISLIHTGMSNIPFMSGYSPERWRTGTNSIIPKETGNYNIKRLRTILLYEADFNFNNKTLAKRMMASAEKAGVIAPEQYGSRNGMNAIECALNKRLMFDILRQTKRPAGICSCDLHSCYDRIVHSFASLAMQRAGGQATAITSMFETIRNLKHTVRTCHGESEQSFGGEDWREIDPLHGVGQGNGAGPAIWAVISTVFFDLLRDKGYGFKTTTPLSKQHLHLAGCGFVDDTDLLQTGEKGENYRTVVKKLQEALSWWETCTRVSGGAVVPRKSWYGIVHFEWNEGEWSYTSDIADTTLRVKDMNEVNTNLQILNPHEAKRMLGVFLAMDGSNDVQIKQMGKVASSWHEKIRVGYLSRGDAWTALNTTVMKKLEYPLLALTLTKEECNKIMSPILQGGLPRIGVCRTMARALVYTPLKYQGLDIKDLYISQGLQHIKALLNHIWRRTTTGTLLRTTMEHLKIEVGLTGSILSNDYQLYGELAEESWIKHLWKFLMETGIQINDKIEDFEMSRENDIPINVGLAKAFNEKKITKTEWKRANKCRMYLQVLTIGDIATAEGTEIEEGIMKGDFHRSRARRVNWPYQQKPKSSYWTIWRKVLRKGLLGDIGQLQNKVGRWIRTTEELYKGAWEWWLDPVTNVLYKNKGNGWLKFIPLTQRARRRRTQRNYSYYQTMEEEPQIERLMRTSVKKERGSYIAKGYHSQKEATYPERELVDSETNREMNEDELLPAVMRALDDRIGEQWAVREVTTTIKINEIVEDIANGTAVAVSDGSYKDNGGTAAWIIESKDGAQRMQGVVNVPGMVLDQSSYRSELAGIYGSVMVVEVIKEVIGLKKGGILIGCDGKSALEQSISVEENLCTCSQQHFDLISGIQGYIKDSCLKYTSQYIKGHQDRANDYQDLDRLAILNVQADALAKEYWEKRYGQKGNIPLYTRYSVPKGIWEITLVGQRISKELMEYLRENIKAEEAYDYWVEHKKRLSKNGFLDVDWNANKKAMKSVKNSRRQWVTKFESGICGTGRMMKIWKQRVIDNCPRCGKPNETTTHVLQCNSETATAIWEVALSDLENWLRDNKTCPDLRKLLVRVINQWRLGEEVRNLESFEFESCEGVYPAQKEIGWRQLMGGCMSSEWAKAQEDYYKWLGMRRTGERWVVELIKKLWKISWDLWQDRNERLHRTSMEAILSGVASLDIAIREEHQLGNEGLPKIVQDKFPIDIEEIINSPLTQKKAWFVLVRAARELTHDERIQDEFTDPRSYLRKWVGLQ